MDPEPMTDPWTGGQGEETAREVCTEREGEGDREGKGGGGGSGGGSEKGQVEVRGEGADSESRALLASQDLGLWWEGRLLCVCVCVCVWQEPSSSEL